ncbi:hypothetical protein [Nostoc sp. T09]|uniref:hypothetical protein n=1 Tax=Nostoc sp. T09 TaxID=1932621 RepID=UPI0015C50924|nr:hypothetical protein [Nostoc sp. T09]
MFSFDKAVACSPELQRFSIKNLAIALNWMSYVKEVDSVLEICFYPSLTSSRLWE